MSFTATFRFHGSLQDFLPAKIRQQVKLYAFTTPSSIKDAVEAIGVPHVEVRKVVVNNEEKGFTYLLQPSDNIEVFPSDQGLPVTVAAAFVLDVHLGKLARLLRMLGIDAVYENHYRESEIVAISASENRAVLTRDAGLLKHKVLTQGYWLRSQWPEEQLLEVIRYFSLCTAFVPFSRCIRCNGMLLKVAKDKIIALLPPQTQACFDEFYQCESCKKVCWKGSHFENMLSVMEKIKSVACHGVSALNAVT